MPIPVSVKNTEPEPDRNDFGSGSGFGRKFRFRSFTSTNTSKLILFAPEQQISLLKQIDLQSAFILGHYMNELGASPDSSNI